MTPNLPTTDTRTPQQWFDEVFWVYYPRPEPMFYRSAKEQFISIVTGTHPWIKGEARVICTGAYQYAKHVTNFNTDTSEIKLPTEWLHNARWFQYIC